MKQYVLGIDIGGSSVKLTALAYGGQTAGSASCEYPTKYPQPGWSEQDPKDWCRAFKKALVKLKSDYNITPSEIAALAIDAATHTAVLLDESYRPVADSIFWRDQRSAEEADDLHDNYGKLILSLCKNKVTAVWTLPQLMWIKKHRSEVWLKTKHILFAKDYLRLMLTDVPATDFIDAMGSLLYDVQKQCWSQELCEIGEIPREWLPPLLAPEEEAGRVTAKAAEEFGLTEGTPVLTGTTDTVMELLAVGNIAPGDTSVKLATAGRICVVTDRNRPSPFLFNYRHVVQGLWYPGTGTSSCAASFRWYRDHIGRADYDTLTEAAKKIPVGSDGLFFHPYLQGEMTPYHDPLLRASYVGISSMHGTAHFTRATLEGIVFSLRDCVDTLTENSLAIRKARIIGGGSGSELWRQITADVLGISLEKNRIDDSSFGSAILAAKGIGWYADYSDAVRECIEVISVTDPVADHHDRYEEIFKQYRAVQRALTPIYHDRKEE